MHMSCKSALLILLDVFECTPKLIYRNLYRLHCFKLCIQTLVLVFEMYMFFLVSFLHESFHLLLKIGIFVVFQKVNCFTQLNDGI